MPTTSQIQRISELEQEARNRAEELPFSLAWWVSVLWALNDDFGVPVVDTIEDQLGQPLPEWVCAIQDQVLQAVQTKPALHAEAQGTGIHPTGPETLALLAEIAEAYHKTNAARLAPADAAPVVSGDTEQSGFADTPPEIVATEANDPTGESPDPEDRT